jgi:hypothetical protein
VAACPNSLYLSLGEWPRLPFTARIERAHSYRARSASKKGTWPLPTLLAAFFNSLLGFRLNTFDIKPYLDFIADDEPAAIQRLIPDHTEILTVEFPLRAETSPGIAPGILR